MGIFRSKHAIAKSSSKPAVAKSSSRLMAATPATTSTAPDGNGPFSSSKNQKGRTSTDTRVTQYTIDSQGSKRLGAGCEFGPKIVVNDDKNSVVKDGNNSRAAESLTRTPSVQFRLEDKATRSKKLSEGLKQRDAQLEEQCNASEEMKNQSRSFMQKMYDLSNADFLETTEKERTAQTARIRIGLRPH